jgi:general nucleoside transport system permease protein
MSDLVPVLSNLISSGLLAGGVLALAGAGEIVNERAGVLNLGIEGFMAVGAVAAIAAVTVTGNLWFGVAAAAVLGLMLGLAFALVVVLIGVDQVVAGLGFSFLGSGLAAWLGAPYAGTPAAVTFARLEFPVLGDLSFFGKAIFSLPLPTYAAFLLCPLLVHLLLFRTRLGLSICSVGENPAAADAAGVPVVALRCLCVTFGGMMASLSGAYLTLVLVPTWSEGLTGGRGWITLALVIFAGYRPLRLAVASFGFGLITAAGFSAQVAGVPVNSAFLSALPYVATLSIMLVAGHRARRTSRPAGLGIPFDRETR